MQAVFHYERIKQERLKRKWTQEELAYNCGSSDRYIRDLENGRKLHPSADMICRIASALEIPMETLYVEAEE